MIKDIKELNFPEYATLSQATVNIADMGERSITTQIKIDGDVVPDFSYDWEVEYKGERYVHTAREPQASKDNTSRRTSIDLTFKHWAIVELQRYYFVEMASTEAGTAVADKYQASLGLSLPDFVNAFNNVLDYYFNGAIRIVLNPAWVASSEASFVEINYSYLWDVLQKVYEIYGVRWTIEPVTGKSRNYLIKFGYEAPEASHIFEYGYKGGLLKVERQVQSADIKNIILGRGGNKNLPYLYFKDYDKYGTRTSEDTSSSNETKTISGVTAPSVSSLPKYGKTIVKAKYMGTFEIPEGKSGVLTASVPTATGYYTANNAPAYIPENGKFIWDKNKEVNVVFISLGSPNIQVYNKETDEQVSQVAIPSGKYYYTWDNEVANNYTDTLHDIVVTLPNLTLITGSGSVIGASSTGNKGFRPDPDAIPELKDIAFTELRSSEFREYIQGWKVAHYGGAIPTEQSEAFIKGLTDEKFNPVEYVKDDNSIAKYGKQWGALDNNDEIYPSIQGSGIDDIIDVEQIQTDAVDNADLFAFTEDIDIPQRATGLVIEPFSTVEYSFYVEGSDKFQYDNYKNSVLLSSYELEAKDLSNQQYVGADSFDVVSKEIQVLTTAFDWGKIRITLNITNNSDKRVSVVKFLGRLKVYYRLNGTTDDVGNALWATSFSDYAPTKTGSQSKLTRSANLYCYHSNTKRAIIHIPNGYVGISPQCKLGDTKIRRDDNVSTENLVYEVKFKNAVFIDITNENNTYDFAGENDIPAGDYYIKYTYEYSVTNVPNNKSWMLSQGVSLSLTLKAEHPELLKSPYTFDIWVKNLWDTEKREDETDKQYAERVWFPIIGQNDAKITFTSGLLAISSDYQFKITKGGINYDTSKEHNGEQSHWRLTLQKSDAEYESTGLYIPNTRINAKSGDKFFFTNIELPHQYVLWAEKKLHDYKVDNLEQVSDIKPTWGISLDKVRCNNVEEGDVKKLIDQIQVGSAIRISHPFITDAPYNTLYAQSATYTYNEPSEGNLNIYPDVEVVLSDKVVTVTNPVSLMQGEIDALRQLVGGSLSNIEQVIRAVGDRIYLRKDGINDIEAGYVQFQRGARFNGQTDFKDDVIIGKNGYSEGLTGFGIRFGRDGSGEMESLILRRFLEVPELRYNRVDITLGNAWRAVCAGVIENVIPDIDTNGNQLDSGVIYLKLETGEVGSVAVDDICMGIFHNETALTDNAITDSDDSKGNFTFAGFTTVYFRITEILEESNNSTFRYVLRAIDDTWTQKYHPQVGMTFSGYGNFTNKNRQTSKYETRTYERYLKDVDTWTFSARNVAAQFGDLSNLGTLLGVDMTGYSIYLNNIYMTGRIQQLNSQGEEVPVITDRGVWSSSATYYKNDDVYHNNSKWRCLVDGTTSEPSKNSSAWLLLQEVLDGKPGKDGTSVAVSSHNVTYQVGTSGTTAPTGTWSENIPTVSEGQYLWTRTIVNYSDGKSTTSYSVSYQGKNGTTARTYILEPSTLAMKRGQDNALTPTTVTYSSFYQDGNNTERTTYAGRFVIAESIDGSTFTNKYTSSVNESSKVYTPSATNVTAVKCTLYAGGGTSQMLDVQTTVILTDVSNVQPLIDEAKQAAQQAQQTADSLKNFTDTAFADGIIDRAEAVAIEKYKNSVTETKQAVDASYNEVYANALLPGSAKSNLQAAKSAFDTAVANLLDSVAIASDDGIATAKEKADVDEKYTFFNDAYSTYTTRLKEAQAAIETAINTTARDAYALSQESKQVLDNLASVIIPDLQNQIDGQIVSWTGDTEPTLNNYPANEWTTDAEKKRHINDYYDHKITDSYGSVSYERYKFSKSGNTYIWELISDSGAAQALAEARKALGLVEAKSKMFYGDSTPSVPYSINDIWIRTDGSLYICNADRATGSMASSSDWMLVNDAQVRLRQMSSDDVISREEKASLRNMLAQIDSEFAQYKSDATKYGISIANLSTAKDSLVNFLTGTVAVDNDTDTKLTPTQINSYNTYFANYNTEVNRFGNLIANAIANSAVNNINFGSINIIPYSETCTITASDTNNYCFNAFLLEIKVSTSDIFTFRVENITNIVGNPTNYSIAIWSEDLNTSYSQRVEVVAKKEYQLTIDKTDIDNKNAKFVIFAGEAGFTKGNSVKFDHLMLVKGNKMPTIWQHTPKEIRRLIDYAQDVANKSAKQVENINNRLTDWASDKFISPQEKTALKQQQNDIQSEYQDIINQANQYSISTIAFAQAFESANAALTKYTAISPENIPVESDYVNISNYYNDRQRILDAIVTAMKLAVDSAPSLIVTLSNEYQGVPSGSDGVISDFPTCKTIVSVFFGTTDVSSSATYTVTPSGLTGSWDATTRTYTVTSLSADTGYVDIKATYKDLSTTKRFNVAKAKAGEDGVNGCILRTSQWASGAEYHNDTDSKEAGVKYLDVVVINDDNGNQYRFQCAQTHTSNESNKPPTDLVGNAYWSPLSNMAPLYTPLLLADNAEITFTNSTRILIKDANGNVCAGMMADDTSKDTPFWIGANYENRINAPFRVNSKGQGVANDFTINGSYRGSIGYWGGEANDAVFLGDTNGLGRKDNIVIPLNRSNSEKIISHDHFPWGVENIGRVMRLINYKWVTGKAVGRTIIQAPINKYFFENGRSYNQIIISREMIELVGYGAPAGTTDAYGVLVDPIFYGWIVSRRIDLGTENVYGGVNKIVAAGTIMRANDNNLYIHNLWTYTLSNTSTVNLDIVDQNPDVKVVLPTNLVSDNKYVVTLQTMLIPPGPNISDVSIDLGTCALSVILTAQTNRYFIYRPIRSGKEVSPHCVYFEIHSTADFAIPTIVDSASINNEPMADSMAIGQESSPITYVIEHDEGIG